MALSAVQVSTGFLASLDVPVDTVGDRLTLALRRSGMEDGEVAEKAHVTPAWLSAVKNDRIKNPKIEWLRAIATACRVPVRYLTEPLGWVPLDEAELPEWERGLTEDDRDILARMAERLRQKDDPPKAASAPRRAARS